MNFVISSGEMISSINPLKEFWGLPEIYGEAKADKPKLCIFNNIVKAMELLRKHINTSSKIALHTDVDVDGVSTTYIAKETLNNLGVLNTPIVINKEKVHGIQQKHAEFFKNYKIDLMIITDSSCNDIDIIKQFECDVLVVDHHDLEHNELMGKCNDGIHDFIIVNSTIDNMNYEEDVKSIEKYMGRTLDNVEVYKGTQAMSCALAYYEFMRVYYTCFSNVQIIENLKLYQWAAMTLFTDVIDTINTRNQWYLDNTIFNTEIENTLRIILRQLNSYKLRLDKSYIEYTFAPLVNKAIRANKGSDVIKNIINNPSDICELRGYAELQEDMVNRVLNVSITDPNTGLVSTSKRAFNTDYILFDTSSFGVHPNYNGVIASRLQGDLCKNAAIYSVTSDGICQGSFRGKYKEVGYRQFFIDMVPGIYAKGHPGAFGFKATRAQLETIMQNISSIEPVKNPRPLFSVGDIPDEDRGQYHITDMNSFKREGYLLKIAIGNAKVISKDEIFIRVRAEDVKLKETKGKVFIYETYGIECKAFSAMRGKYFDIYLEYSNEICAFLREVKA